MSGWPPNFLFQKGLTATIWITTTHSSSDNTDIEVLGVSFKNKMSFIQHLLPSSFWVPLAALKIFFSQEMFNLSEQFHSDSYSKNFPPIIGIFLMCQLHPVTLVNFYFQRKKIKVISYMCTWYHRKLNCFFKTCKVVEISSLPCNRSPLNIL
jgi:hypothetical protein